MIPENNTVKQAIAEITKAKRSVLIWEHVLAAITSLQTFLASNAFFQMLKNKHLACDAQMGKRESRIAVLDALTKTEDFLEMIQIDLPKRKSAKKLIQDRNKVKTLRRKLERELFK
jgi:hypothetical protein